MFFKETFFESGQFDNLHYYKKIGFDLFSCLPQRLILMSCMEQYYQGSLQFYGIRADLELNWITLQHLGYLKIVLSPKSDIIELGEETMEGM